MSLNVFGHEQQHHVIPPPPIPLLPSLPPDIYYYCNITEYPLLPSPLSPEHQQDPSTSISLTSLYTTLQPYTTTYTHISHINGTNATYNTDCSCYISYLLHSATLIDHFNAVPKDYHQGVVPASPRAGGYFELCDGLRSREDREGLWEGVGKVEDLRAGDLVSWRIVDTDGGDGEERRPDADTGHVVVVGRLNEQKYGKHDQTVLMDTSIDISDPKVVVPYNETAYWIHVIDASKLRHEEDSRCSKKTDEDDRYECIQGVGRGKILVSVNDDGSPKAFQFRLGSTPRYYPIAMARLK
ncbi:hypothetical protein HDU76_008220 [Blyttiomyces sp. JEL0837]|nr:hypothetical protein HDU76_008220 [Blyttiomyces sp. JEL0837]